MHVTFVMPHVGRKDPSNLKEYVRTWQMEPLPLATVAGATPDGVEVILQDERIEHLNFDLPTNLVAINVEAYTAKRAYEIAAQYRLRGIPTILGGYHATLVPDEGLRFADSVLIGYAEPIWEQVVRDAEHGQLQRSYTAPPGPMRFGQPRRSLVAGRPYLPVTCVETGRGCSLHCTFCSIMSATGSRYYPRPIDAIVADIVASGQKRIFFIDDNIVGSPKWTKELCRAITPLGLTWFSQGTVTMGDDPELLELMAASGCLGVLIGFESFKPETLQFMKKRTNLTRLDHVRQSIRAIHEHGMCIYGTFIYGYDPDDLADYRRVAEEAIDLDLFMVAFNPLIPFPGTPLYQTLVQEGRVQERWWLDPAFRYGDIPFRPAKTTAEEVHRVCIEARHRFYSIGSIARRMRNLHGNCNSPLKILAYLGINLQLRQEITDKDGIPLGNHPLQPVEVFHELNLPIPPGGTE